MVEASPPDARQPQTGLHTKFAFVAILCSTATTALEGSVISIGLPGISEYFDVSAAQATWVMAMSQFVIVALMLPMAALGDIFGHRRVFLLSYSIFAAAALVCVLAPSFEVLIAARAVQAIGTAGAMSLGFALARTVFSDKTLGTAIGLMAATVALTGSLGPTVAGLILEVFNWRGIFGLMLALSFIAIFAGALTLPKSAPSGKPYDFVGAGIVAVTIAALLCCINGFANAWPVMVLAVGGLVAVIGSIIMVRRSLRSASPVFPVDLLARPIFSLSIMASICAFIVQSIGFVFLPFYLILGAGLGPFEMALTMSVWPATTAIIAPIVGRVSASIPAGPAGAVGLTTLAIGFALMSTLSGEVGAVQIAIYFAICGAGFAIFQTPNNRVIMLSAPKARSGAASGSLSLARQFGRAAGIAFAAFILAHGGNTGSLEAMKIGAVIAVIGAAFSLVRIWFPIKATD